MLSPVARLESASVLFLNPYMTAGAQVAGKSFGVFQETATPTWPTAADGTMARRICNICDALDSNAQTLAVIRHAAIIKAGEKSPFIIMWHEHSIPLLHAIDGFSHAFFTYTYGVLT